jgi:hypothetical protein
MSAVKDIPVEQLREAAAAWRAHELRPSPRVWPFASIAPSLSVYDRIDEMIDEIERLRKEAK